MTFNIPIPSSRVGAEMARAINRNRLMALPGQLVSDGPYGRSFSHTVNRRDRRATSATTESLSFIFKVRAGTESDESTPAKSRAFIDMLCTSSNAVSYQGAFPSAGHVYGFSSGESCDLSADGWQRIHQTDFSSNPPALAESVFLFIDFSNPKKPTWNITNAEPSDYAVRVLVASVSGETANQLVMGFLTLTAPADNASVSLNDKAALQLSHFADKEKDSSKGLATRLKANVETGEITASDDNIMIVCRDKSGQIIYVPLSGSGKDPDPEPQPEEKDPCDHPGGGSGSDGGVPAGGATDHPQAKQDGTGGVPADGDTHTGDGCQGEKCK